MMKDLPKELIDGRETEEATFVFCLYKQPDLFSDYLKLNEDGDETLITDDGKFYFSIGKQMFLQGFKTFDNVTMYSFLESKPTLKKRFDVLGGYRSVEELKGLVHVENVDAYYDTLVKMNFLISLHEKGFNVLSNIEKFRAMTSQQVYDWYDYFLNSLGIQTSQDIEIETLEIDDVFLQKCDEGEAMGVSYGKRCPLLNNCTLGVPLGELYMFGGYSGSGKSSFVFGNMIIPMTEAGRKCVVISNEQRSKDFKYLLLVHILTQDLNYWGLTRKRIKQGKFTDEQWEMLRKAEEISKEKYSNIRFVKLFDNNMNRVKQVIKKLSKVGYQVFMFDTMKSDDEIDGAMWQQLLIHSRKLFQIASKENIALICTYQLALHTLNRRYLDASCLSNAKQIKEIFSEMVYLREIWQDEWEDEKFDIKPHNFVKTGDGKYRKQEIQLDPTKKYMVLFLDKTRNNEDKIQILYQFNGRYNIWKEIGYCTVTNLHV